jgi:large repetitive protein
VNTGSHLTFSWDFGDGVTASGTLITHTYSSMGLYTATVTASNAISAQSADITVLVEEAIKGLNAVNSSPTILGQPTTFTATIAAGSDVSFAWDFGDGSMGNGALVKYTYPAYGIYTATVTASNAVDTQSAQTEIVVEEAISGLNASAGSPTILGQPTAFTATIATGSNVIFTWDFGDGDSGQGPIVVHSYSSPGIFTATLTASNLVSHKGVELPILIIQSGNKIYLPLSMKSK